MRIIRVTNCLLLLVIVGIAVPGAFGAGAEITNVDVVPDGDTVRINIELTSPVRPLMRLADSPSRLILLFQNVSSPNLPRRLQVNLGGVSEIRTIGSDSAQAGSTIIVGMDSARPFGIEPSGNTLVVRIFPHFGSANTDVKSSLATPSANHLALDTSRDATSATKMIAGFSTGPSPEVESTALTSTIDESLQDSPAMVRSRFKIKFVSGNTAYIDSGSNSGLRAGMNLDIVTATGTPAGTSNDDNPIGAARIIGVATTSAILEVGSSSGELHVGDWANLLPVDAELARRNVLTAPGNTLHAASRLVEGDSDSSQPLGQGYRANRRIEEDPGTRTAGRIGFDYSSISSSGSAPGTSTQVGLSFQSDIRHILGTHWNLEGYWRSRINRHSQFQDATIEDSLNKTYTMQLYYDNPNGKWVAGVGRLYLPWAVSLDTIDGGYFGRKFGLGNTTGVFAGSTPDLSSWHYRPNQRIGGAFTNFGGGDYDRFHFSSTTGAALTSIQWKLDRPFVFFENELSYKGKVSAYHSLILDSLQGVSTNGIRPGAGVSHSYFTLHYRPMPVVSFDLYHNFFRDVPTAVTTIVGTGLEDKLLFQGISAGTHVMPSRHFTLYTTLGASEKTGDAHRSLNETFGATWNEIAHTGLRADFHYSKFDSNFASGHYEVLSLSRQLTNRMFWNVQLGKQDIESLYTLDSFSNFVDDSFDVNLGRHSYLQSGYTYVNGATMNYRQWYMSWGYRFDEGRRNPQYVQTVAPRP
jgi:AMIN domain